MVLEFKDSFTWLREAVAGVGVETERQVHPDGAQMELTVWYYFTALRNFASALELAAVNGYDIPAKLHEGLRGVCEHIARVATLKIRPAPQRFMCLGLGALGNALVSFPGTRLLLR